MNNTTSIGYADDDPVDKLRAELEAIQQHAARIKAAMNSFVTLEGLVNSIATKGENHE